MKFGSLATTAAEGAILAHSVRAGERMLRKGRVLSADDIAALVSAGVSDVVAAQLAPDDVPEDEAAARIAKQLAGTNVRVAAPFTGRANLFATKDGLAQIDEKRIAALNGIDESITIATLPPFHRVMPRQMLATVKVIPFAAPRSVVEQAERLLSEPAISTAAFHPRKIALIVTTLPTIKRALIDKTRSAIAARVKDIGSDLVSISEVPHTTAAVAEAIANVGGDADLILVFGASAITDRRDVIPASIERAGGSIIHFGMPVDPGNLLLIGKLHGADVVGVPSCARSPKLNGFDFVLWRLAAGLPLTGSEIAAMGVGGLLTEIPLRPQPREESPMPPRAPKVAAIVLAAGASSRMGRNKLLAEIGGAPMVRRAVDAALSSAASHVIVVTGNDAERVRAALAGQEVDFVDNAEFREGLSGSLKRGLSRVPDDCDGALVLLGDMPDVDTHLIDRLIAAFDPTENRAICLATRNGKRGNPVLFARRFFGEIEAIDGDVGARGLIGEYPDLMCEVEAGSDAPLIDIDTPEALDAYLKERA
jgi:molybdenum cofactor cytidylyltransferase